MTSTIADKVQASWLLDRQSWSNCGSWRIRSSLGLLKAFSSHCGGDCGHSFRFGGHSHRIISKFIAAGAIRSPPDRALSPPVHLQDLSVDKTGEIGGKEHHGI